MPLKARQRSRLAVLAVLALVGSLLAVSAVPVAAEDGKMDHEATYSACVGPAAEDAGFTDTDGNTHEAAINCLAHYGITMGTSEGVYSPTAAVTRVQMALFLHRAAAPAGIDLPAASDQGFTDIGNWSDAAQDAVNLMAELGIMSGRSSTEFMPTDLVTRSDMSVHIAEFLSDALTGPGGTDIDDDDFEADDTVFVDIDNATKSAYDAIRDLYELGVTKGLTETTYGPEGLVTRAQMAAYITRALAHTNARPAGLTVQTETTDHFTGETAMFVASVRDSNHLPVPDDFVDHFYFIEDNEDDEPFDDDGACTDDVDGGCDIASDPTTDVDGNVEALEVPVGTDDVRVWFWTGDLGDEFDEDDDDAVTFTLNASPAAMNTQVVLSHNHTDNIAKFGETATLTIQLVDGDNEPVMKADVKVTVAVIETNPDGSTSTSSKTEETDASGRIVKTWTQEDPDSAEGEDHSGMVTVTITPADLLDPDDEVVVDADGKAITDADATVDGDQDDADATVDGDQYRFAVKWDDDDPVPTTLKVDSARKYAKASDKGRGVSNTVRATLTDQYGDGINRAKIQFVSTGAGGDKSATPSTYMGAADLAKTTNRNGVASLSYQRDSVEAATETFNVNYRLVRGVEDTTCETANNDDDLADICLDTATDTEFNAFVFYWATNADPGTGETDRSNNGVVQVVDKDSNVAIVSTGASTRYVEWDSNDAFTIGTSPVLLAEFEKQLDVGDTLASDYAGEDGDGDGVATFTLTNA